MVELNTIARLAIAMVRQQPVKAGAQKIVLIKALRVVQMYQSAVLLIIPTVVNIRLCVMMGIIKVQTVYAASYVGWGLQHCVQAVG